MPRSPKNEDTERDLPRIESTFEDIDMALYAFVDKTLDIQTKTNKGFVKVPVIWSGAERAQNVKNDSIKRDADGMIIYPVIAIERGAVVKDLEKKTLPYAALDPTGDIKRGFLTVNRVIKQDKTSNFAKMDAMRQKGQMHHPIYKNKKNEKIVYETITIPVPVYVEIDYKISLRTEYQQQMNDLLTPFIRYTNGHRRAMISHNRNTYEAFVEDSFAANNNIANYQQEEKKFETAVTIKVLGYLIGNGDNQITPRAVRRENAVQIRFARERVIMQDVDGEFRF
tara:strand:+ start:1499 stop:2344 length:846 start_codon:yes stop_codon:yes gene_type:complete